MHHSRDHPLGSLSFNLTSEDASLAYTPQLSLGFCEPVYDVEQANSCPCTSLRIHRLNIECQALNIGHDNEVIIHSHAFHASLASGEFANNHLLHC